MNRKLFIIPVALLIFLIFEFLGSDASDSGVGTSPRANQYHEKINKLVLIGGGSISEVCHTSLKHTVLVTCQTNTILNTDEIYKSLQIDAWQKIPDTEFGEFKFRKLGDILTVQQIKDGYAISLRAEK